MLASLIFWGSSTPAKSIDYTDSLFLVVSAMTLTGVNSVNLSEINTFQQFILFLLILLGSAILVSIAVIFVRLKAFERRFKTIVEEVEEEKRKQKERQREMQKERGSLRRRMTFRANSVSSQPIGNGELRERHTRNTALAEEGVSDKDLEMGGKMSPIAEESHREPSTKHEPLTINTNTDSDTTQQTKADDHVDLPNGTGRKRGVTFSQIPASPVKLAPLARILSMQGVGARYDLPNHPLRINNPETLLIPDEEHHEKINKKDLIYHFSIPGIIGRNSHFSNLSIHSREKIGGVEYRALELLALVVPLYFVAWQFLGSIGMGAWVKNNGQNLTEENGLNPWWAFFTHSPRRNNANEHTRWVGAFNAISGFNNSGMSLLDANMVAFQGSRYMLLTVGLLILAGNTW